MPVADGPPLPAELADRYLAALGVPRREPGREALEELVAAHVSRVPFENVSKLYRLKRLGLTGLPPRDGEGRFRLELHRGGAPRHGYVAKPGARAPDDFRDVIAESFRPDATFMNAVTICRFEPHGAVVVRNLEVLEVTPRTFTSRALPDREALVALAEERFGIPSEIVAEAVGALRGLRDAWR